MNTSNWVPIMTPAYTRGPCLHIHHNPPEINGLDNCYSRLIMKNTKAPNVEDKDLRGKYNSVTSTIGLVLAFYSVTLLPQIIVVQDYLIEPCKGSEEAICGNFVSIQILFISQFLILFIGGLWVSFSSITKTKLNDTVEKDEQEKVEIRCPYCEQNLTVPSNHEGDATCPLCSMEFIVESKLRVTIEV